MFFRKRIKQLILLAGDVIALCLALYLALTTRYLAFPASEVWNAHFEPFLLIFSLWLLTIYIIGLYSLRPTVKNINFFKVTGPAFSITTLVSFVYFYLDQDLAIAPKTILILFAIFFFILFFIWRLTFSWMINTKLPKNNIAIIGYTPQVEELINELMTNPQSGYLIAFVLDDKEREILNVSGVPILQGITDLKNLLQQNKVNTIVLASTPHQSSELRNILFDLLDMRVNYINLPNFYEAITGKVPLDAINQMWFLENLSEGNKNFFDLFKRVSDIVLATLVLLISIVFWPIVALIIKLESNGPVFFSQTRQGKNGKPFKMIKFRTMKAEDNNYAPTTQCDSRVTRFGSIMRKTRIDEIPQVLNILKGEMSFVGPRPERPELAQMLSEKIPYFNERLLVKPGVTGWDQVCGQYHSPSVSDTFQKLQYDLFYIKNRSVYLDLSILLKTIAIMLSRQGY